MKWPTIPLGDLCTLHNGKAFKESDWSISGQPIIRIQNLNGRGSTFNHWAGSLSGQIIVRPGNLLLAWSGTPGTSFGAHIWRGPEGVLNQHIFRVDLDSQRIDTRWAMRAINQQLNRLIDLAHGGVGLKHVTRGTVQNLLIPLPPLSEQRRIAAILDKAEALRAKRRQALAKLDTLTQSLFSEMFGGHEQMTSKSQLDELLLEGDGINYGVVQPGDEYPDGKPLIRVGDFHNGGISTKAIKRIDPVIESGYKRSRLRGGEILVSCVGSIGAVAMATPELSGFNIARAVARIPLDREKINPLYLESYLRTPFIQRYFVSELRTVTQPTLNIKQITETLVYVPSRELQDKFALRLTAIRLLATSQVASQDKIARIFSSLQHRAFGGEL